MPQIYSNFIFRSKQPNFERDSFDTYKEMTSTDPDWIDEGHISYCKEKETHYVFRNSKWIDINSYITDLNAESIEDDIIQNIVFKVDDIKSLTDALAAELSLGRIVYVYENNKLYYNTYDKTNGNKSTPAIHIEGGTGWFFPILNHEDLQSIDEAVSDIIDLNLGSNIDDINKEISVLKSNVTDIIDLNLGSNIDGINKEIGVLKSNISSIEKNYVKKEDLPEFGDSEVTKEDLDKISEQVLSAVTAAGSTQKSLDEFKKDVEDTYASKTDLNEYVKNTIFQDSQAATISRIQNIEKDIDENIKPKLNNIAHQDDLDELKNNIDNEFDSYKQYVEDTYAKPDDISSLLNNYSPSIDYENKWIGSDFAGDLAGKTGEEVAKEHYTYNEVLDEMLFGDYTPTRTEPSVNVDLFPEWNGEQSINWYDKDNRIILVESGSKGPDGNDFIATNRFNYFLSEGCEFI